MKCLKLTRNSSNLFKEGLLEKRFENIPGKNIAYDDSLLMTEFETIFQYFKNKEPSFLIETILRFDFNSMKPISPKFSRSKNEGIAVVKQQSDSYITFHESSDRNQLSIQTFLQLRSISICFNRE